MNIGLNIARALEAKGWNPARLAREMGVSRSTVHGWIHGEPRLKTLRRIAELLDTTLQALLAEEAPAIETGPAVGAVAP